MDVPVVLAVRRWLGAVVVLMVLLPSIATAQAGPAPDQPLVSGSKDAATKEAESDAELDHAWRQYHSAFVSYISGDVEQSRRTLQRLIADFPNHPAAGRAHSALQSIEMHTASRKTSEPKAVDEKSGVAVGEEEAKSSLARAELVSFQTLHGIGVGLEICAFIPCEDGRAFAGALTLAGGAGFGLSLLASRNGVKPGFTLAVDSGTLWGFYNGALIYGLSGGQSSRAFVAMAMTGQAVGIGAGALAHYLWEPAVGQVSTVNSGIFWSNIVALWILGINGFDVDESVVWGTLLAATQVGLVGGSLVAAHLPMSRGRTLLIDAGGALGSLLGLAIPLLITNGDAPSAVIAGSGLAGTVAGLAAATALTRNWDAPDLVEHHALHLGFAPNFDGTGVTASLGGRF